MRELIRVLTFVGLGLVTGARAEDAFGPASVRPAAIPFRIGSLKLIALHDAQFVVPNDAKTFAVDAGVPAATDLLRAAGAPTDRITLSVNALLVRTGRRVLLLDTGLGPKAHGTLMASLGEAGVSPQSVTDVLLTHSHGDHAGGLLDANGQLAFPKAAIRMSSAEWAWLQQKGPADLVKAISGHVHTFEPGTRIAPGVTSVALAGHTAGHVGYEISSGHTRLLDIGDLAHSSLVSLKKPEWTVQFDSDSDVAKKTRATTLARLASDQELVFSPHFPFPGVGHVATDGAAFAWKAGVP